MCSYLLLCLGFIQLMHAAARTRLFLIHLCTVFGGNHPPGFLSSCRFQRLLLRRRLFSISLLPTSEREMENIEFLTEISTGLLALPLPRRTEQFFVDSDEISNFAPFFVEAAINYFISSSSFHL